MRKATESDQPDIARLACEAGMGELTPRGRSYIATDGSRTLGFVRVVQIEGKHFVEPIVVDASVRRLGIGSKLMEYIQQRYEVLRFVARGNAVLFYESLGCKRTIWSEIASIISSDCLHCPDFDSCNPIPMELLQHSKRPQSGWA